MAHLMKNLQPQPWKAWSVKDMADEIAEGQGLPAITRNVIASYNWDNDSNVPKIAVPGAPRQFRPIDGGNYRYAMNNEWATSKDSNLNAMFAAVRILKADFKLSNYDIACDLGTLSGFFYFCLLVVNNIRARTGKSRISVESGYNSVSLRIDVQKVGNTLLLIREKPTFKPACGIGPAFRNDCGKVPSSDNYGSEMIRNHYVRNGIYRMVSEIGFGNLKLLLANEINAAIYPNHTEDAGGQLIADDRAKQLKDSGIEITVGGYKGVLNSLIPISFATRSVAARNPIVSSKWMNQYLYGTQFRYVGRHEDGVIHDAPELKTVHEMRQMCGLDEEAATLWAVVLRHLLEKVTTCIRGKIEGGDCFAMIVGNGYHRLQIHDYLPGAMHIETVSKKTLEYLEDNLG